MREEDVEDGRPQFDGSKSSAGRTSHPSSPITGRVLRGGEEFARRLGDLWQNGEPERAKGGEGEGSEL